MRSGEKPLRSGVWEPRGQMVAAIAVASPLRGWFSSVLAATLAPRSMFYRGCGGAALRWVKMWGERRG